MAGKREVSRTNRTYKVSTHDTKGSAKVPSTSGYCEGVMGNNSVRIPERSDPVPVTETPVTLEDLIRELIREEVQNA